MVFEKFFLKIWQRFVSLHKVISKDILDEIYLQTK